VIAEEHGALIAGFAGDEAAGELEGEPVAIGEGELDWFLCRVELG
jgi:hypothetical protein